MPILRMRTAVLCALLLLSCAKQGFPPGGPADTTPPRILATAPKPDTTLVPLNTIVELAFSETVERRSCEESIFITPLAADGVRYRWHGKKLAIHFPGGLMADRTYVITVGVGCKDLRNNTMPAPFSLAFSTGDHLDHGSLSGRIFSESELENVQIWAYDLQTTPSPNPAEQGPLYVTQPDKQGRFNLRYLALVAYRLFAVQDRDRNQRYNAQSEALAVAADDFALSASRPSRTDITLRLAVRDTTAPRLVAVNAPDRRHVDLQFSERLATCDSITIRAGADSLAVLDYFIDHSNNNYVRVLTGEQIADLSYDVRVHRAFDSAGFAIDTTFAGKSFKASAVPDTVKPRYVAMTPRDSSRSVPLDQNFTIWFSKTMQADSLRRYFCLQDTFKNRIEGELSVESNRVSFKPEQPLPGNTLFHLGLPAASICDRSGNRLADTLFVKKIRTVLSDTLSEISGTISDADSLAQGWFYLEVRSSNGTPTATEKVKAGPYRFPALLPGAYTMRCFRDEDDNGQYTLGEPFPFKPAERFHVYPDTLEVRSRWPNEGNDLELPKP